jgi:hypothetical protein
MSIKAMKMALEFIESRNKSAALWMVPDTPLTKTVTALRDAIAQAEKPVAWRWKALVNGEFVSNWVLTHSEPPPYATESMPLYTAPRQWVELTDDEARALVNRATFGDRTNWQALVYMIDAKLKEKNDVLRSV